MYFKQVAVGGYDDNFSYLIGDDDTREVAIVDPDNNEVIMELIEEDRLKPVAILVTHEHHDHTAGAEALSAEYDIPVYIHSDGRRAVSGVQIEELGDGDVIDVGDVEIEVLHTPGHAPGAVCFLADGKLLTGDTLFVGGCGRCDLEGSDVEEMYDSLLNRLAKLPDDIEIYPGHDYGDRPFSTIGEEKDTNPYLNCDSLEEFEEKRF